MAGRNILHDYVNWTYRLEIYAMPPNTYDPKDGELIIADSGIAGSKQRSKLFPVDMNIDNLEIGSIVGLGKVNRNTGVTTFTFDIIEPYSCRLFANLKAVQNKLAPDAQWNSGFYCLVIKWLGYTDQGYQVSDIASKVIPFTFVNIEMQITAAGSKYHCTAVGTEHTGLGTSDNIVPNHIELQGDTVDKVINGPNSKDGIKCLKDMLNIGELEEVQASGGKLPSIANVYDFNLPEEISGSKVYNDDYRNITQVPLVDAQDGKNWFKLQETPVRVPLDLQKNIFRAQAGTKVSDFLDQVIAHSEWMRDQPRGGGDLTLWKITMVTKYIAWDSTRNDYAKNFIYNVDIRPVKGKAPPNVSTPVTTIDDAVRVYNYIFTGKNEDIIRFDLNFKMAFWTPLNSSKVNYLKDQQNMNPQPTEQDAFVNPSTTDGVTIKRKNLPSRGLANRNNTGGSVEDPSVLAVHEIMEYIFDNSMDLITNDLEIVGDPDWISTGIYGGDTVDFTNEQRIYINFMMPTTDYNDNTGLFDTGDGAYFRGVYEVNFVKSTFRNGKFTQILKVIRDVNQKNDVNQQNNENQQNDV